MRMHLAEGGMPARNKKNFRPTDKGAGMTRAGVMAYRRKNPGSKLKTAVTGKVKKGSAAAKRRKSYCARSAGQMKKFPDLSGDGKVTMKDVLMGRGVIPRKGKKGGGLMEATSRLRAQGLKKGGIARGCGAVMSDRRKKTKMY